MVWKPDGKSDSSSLDFVLNRFIMKLFKTANIAVVGLLGVLSSKRVHTFDVKFTAFDDLLFTQIICLIFL